MKSWFSLKKEKMIFIFQLWRHSVLSGLGRAATCRHLQRMSRRHIWEVYSVLCEVTIYYIYLPHNILSAQFTIQWCGYLPPSPENVSSSYLRSLLYNTWSYCLLYNVSSSYLQSLPYNIWSYNMIHSLVCLLYNVLSNLWILLYNAWHNMTIQNYTMSLPLPFLSVKETISMLLHHPSQDYLWWNKKVRGFVLHWARRVGLGLYHGEGCGMHFS